MLSQSVSCSDNQTCNEFTTISSYFSQLKCCNYLNASGHHSLYSSVKFSSWSPQQYLHTASHSSHTHKKDQQLYKPFDSERCQHTFYCKNSRKAAISHIMKLTLFLGKCLNYWIDCCEIWYFHSFPWDMPGSIRTITRSKLQPRCYINLLYISMLALSL